jgi:hypothetical protein
MLRFDLAAAGIAYRDTAGLVFDFHALRCQCATLLDLAGVTPRVVQKHMRHSTLELTGRYTRPRAVDLERAASAMPDLRPSSPDALPTVATGTEGQPIGDPLAHYLPTGGGGLGRSESDSGGMGDDMPPIPPGCKPWEGGGLDASGRPEADTGGSAPRRTRTFNPLIKSRAVRRESDGSNSLRENTLSRIWSRRWTTSLCVFYEELDRISSLSLTNL